MTAGLNFLHERGIIHRDIKTPNVLIDRYWRAKLCDYNFAIDEHSTIKQVRRAKEGCFVCTLYIAIYTLDPPTYYSGRDVSTARAVL